MQQERYFSSRLRRRVGRVQASEFHRRLPLNAYSGVRSSDITRTVGEGRPSFRGSNLSAMWTRYCALWAEGLAPQRTAPKNRRSPEARLTAAPAVDLSLPFAHPVFAKGQGCIAQPLAKKEKADVR